MKTEIDYIFKLGIVKKSQDDKPKNLVELKLPSTLKKCNQSINSIGATSYTDCECYKYASTIPLLNTIFEDMNDFEIINELAIKIKGFEENGKLTIFKAMLETLEDITLDRVIKTCNHVKDLILYSDIKSAEDYSRDICANTQDSSILDLRGFENLSEHGLYWMYEVGAIITSYGMIKSNTGLNINERLEPNNKIEYEPQKLREMILEILADNKDHGRDELVKYAYITFYMSEDEAKQRTKSAILSLFKTGDLVKTEKNVYQSKSEISEMKNEQPILEMKM